MTREPLFRAVTAGFFIAIAVVVISGETVTGNPIIYVAMAILMFGIADISQSMLLRKARQKDRQAAYRIENLIRCTERFIESHQGCSCWTSNNYTEYERLYEAIHEVKSAIKP